MVKSTLHRDLIIKTQLITFLWRIGASSYIGYIYSRANAPDLYIKLHYLPHKHPAVIDKLGLLP